MRIFVPYTLLHDATAMVLTGYDYEPVKMVGENDYPKYFQKRWEEGASFINVEHDVVFWHGAIESLQKCEEDWCYFSIAQNDHSPPRLCLAKFSSNFMKEYPTIWDEFLVAPSHEDVPGHTVPKWAYCDVWINHWFPNGDVKGHRHTPPVCNAHPIQKSLKVSL